jgi:hypothetical protein
MGDTASQDEVLQCLLNRRKNTYATCRLVATKRNDWYEPISFDELLPLPFHTTVPVLHFREGVQIPAELPWKPFLDTSVSLSLYIDTAMYPSSDLSNLRGFILIKFSYP